MGIKQQYVNGEISAYAVLDALDAANERITQLEKENKELMYHANSLRCLKESAMEYKDADRYIQRKLKESE